MSETAITISLLALVAVIGLWIGHFKIKGVGLGIGGVLFGGIFVAHFTTQYGIKLDSHTLHFVQEFGLILFVYTIGIQVVLALVMVLQLVQVLWKLRLNLEPR